MANPLSTIAHEVLADVANYWVSIKGNQIKSLFQNMVTGWSGLPADLAEAKSVFDEMNAIYIELGPAQNIAKQLFPELAPIFAILDELSALETKMSAALVPLTSVKK